MVPKNLVPMDKWSPNQFGPPGKMVPRIFCLSRGRLVGHFAYCATPLSLMSFKLSKTFNYQPLFFHSPTQNENVKKVQSVFLPNWNWLFLLIFSLFKVEKIKIHD